MKTIEMLFGFFTWPPTPEQVLQSGTFVLSFVMGAASAWFIGDLLWRHYKNWRDQ